MSLRAILRIGFGIVAFFVIGLSVLYLRQGGISSGGNDTPSILARQVGNLDRAGEGRRDPALTLVAPPTNVDEARLTKAALDTYLSFDGADAIGWERFHAWVAVQGRPGTIASFDQLWETRSNAVAAFRRFVEGLASAKSDGAGAGPWADARRTEQYVALYNAFEQSEDALYNGVVRLTPGDFKN
ncbi:hypothetical protein SAMN05444156_2255 [Verrucomicrobium sp. GAS474]|uniref:hypothetical protein n=1 Tax=Verrucomicrobium sp. GAS474 TaxID=1882831 RepID=UPI00087AF031|nr:hypothetical protein [Verrucomicrobium sp. GAS474]SDU14949.1 hypothetical protein SAMN05444156_2255 [Verrucomicrobium sp. GAS474]